MAKKKNDKLPIGASTPLGNNPFAALAGLELPPGEHIPAAGAASEPSPRFAAKVVVRRETKGRGGKTVTRITGIAPADRDSITSEMKRDLGCGAVVEGDDVVLLGSLVDRAADWVTARGARRVVRSP
jgi:translation initiation factor 1